MKSWEQYLQLREADFGFEDNKSPINPSDTDENGALHRIIDIAWQDHNSETRSFIKRLSLTNPDIAQEYERVSKETVKPNDRDKEEIISPSADRPDDHDFN